MLNCNIGARFLFLFLFLCTCGGCITVVTMMSFLQFPEEGDTSISRQKKDRNVGQTIRQKEWCPD